MGKPVQGSSAGLLCDVKDTTEGVRMMPGAKRNPGHGHRRKVGAIVKRRPKKVSRGKEWSSVSKAVTDL